MLVGVVQSVAPAEIHISAGTDKITVYGSGWTAYADVTIYYGVHEPAHKVAIVAANYFGKFQVTIPTNYIPTIGDHTIIALQGAKKATAVHNVEVASPPDDRLLNPIEGNLKIELHTVSRDTVIEYFGLAATTGSWTVNSTDIGVAQIDFQASTRSLHSMVTIYRFLTIILMFTLILMLDGRVPTDIHSTSPNWMNILIYG